MVEITKLIWSSGFERTRDCAAGAVGGEFGTGVAGIGVASCIVVGDVALATVGNDIIQFVLRAAAATVWGCLESIGFSGCWRLASVEAVAEPYVTVGIKASH